MPEHTYFSVYGLKVIIKIGIPDKYSHILKNTLLLKRVVKGS